jgi:hypothetical protein
MHEEKLRRLIPRGAALFNKSSIVCFLQKKKKKKRKKERIKKCDVVLSVVVGCDVACMM